MLDLKPFFINPFIKDNPIKIVEFIDDYDCTVSLPSAQGKKLSRSIRIPNSYFVDRDSKVSMYLVPGFLEILLGMTNSTKMIFLYILTKIKKNEDKIKLEYNTICKELGITMNTYYTAVEYLTTNQIIQKDKAKDYWINPHYIYNGQRYKSLEEMYGEESRQVVRKINKKMVILQEPYLAYGFENDEIAPN